MTLNVFLKMIILCGLLNTINVIFGMDKGGEIDFKCEQNNTIINQFYVANKKVVDNSNKNIFSYNIIGKEGSIDSTEYSLDKSQGKGEDLFVTITNEGFNLSNKNSKLFKKMPNRQINMIQEIIQDGKSVFVSIINYPEGYIRPGITTLHQVFFKDKEIFKPTKTIFTNTSKHNQKEDSYQQSDSGKKVKASFFNAIFNNSNIYFYIGSITLISLIAACMCYPQLLKKSL